MAIKSEREEYARILKRKEYAREYYRRHIDEERERNRERYAERKRDLALTGLCVKCGKFPAVKGMALCAECRRKNNEAAKRHKEAHRASEKKRADKMNAKGLCSVCGKNPRAKGKNGRKLILCEECRAKQAQANKKRREGCLALGLCTKCGKVPAREGYTMCFECARKNNEHERRRREGIACPESFEGEEFYTGMPTAARCFGCEIPEKYCTGENCVEAFRAWKTAQWEKCEGTEGKG